MLFFVQNHQTRFGRLSAPLLSLLSFHATAEPNDAVVLDQIIVETEQVSAKDSHTNSQQISRGLVWNEHDLVRWQTGITVTEGGRGGANGYSMRGVESDRVAISVDGISAVESYMPRFYYIKGFYNGNRNSTEIENLASVQFNKGANSLTQGSGALGGSVSMQTKTVHDFVPAGKNVGFYAKTAYSSRNEEYRQVVGGGFIYGNVEGLLQYTYRNAHENKNYYSGKIKDINYCGAVPNSAGDGGFEDRRKTYPELCGRGRLLPDNLNYRSQSWLAKLGYHFNQQHFVQGFFENFDQNRKILEKSFYALNRQEASDVTPYQRIGIVYDYTPTKSWLNKFSVQLAQQKVSQEANSNQYGTWTGKDHADYNIVTEQRLYKTEQKHHQLDFSFISNEVDSYIAHHQLQGGFGYHWGKLENKNQEYKYSAYSNSTTTRQFTIQQPVFRQSWYGYIQDLININPKWSANAGLRFDHYRYQPKTSSLKYDIESQEMVALAKKQFSAISYSAGLNYAITDSTLLSYQFSTGFKAPKIEEMYFDLKGSSAVNFLPNINLRAEKAQNHELTLTTEGDNYQLSLTAFYTKYRDFIDADAKPKVASRQRTNWATKEKYTEYYLDGIDYQQINIDKAYVTGIDLHARAEGSLIGLPKNLYTTFKSSYAKGRKNNGTAMLAIQPFSIALGLGYQAEDDKWNLLFSGRYVSAKKASDAMDKPVANSLKLDVNKKTGEISGFEQAKLYRFLSDSYTVFDLTAQYQLNSNFTINAGIFNLFNRKYTTWDSLRQIKYNGAMGDVWNSGEGLERFTEAGRHFALSLEMRF
ncbi:TonB-dependent hemoglobin/transferrin/lactoferrin family receptor [Seminibacterium arietis]|uniref:TonB-dependent hemoglobin/transferrin/lactoferrin family receptor n=1 Tax=Seminibacterium arietis TaxID=1173502 RepID=A0ABW3IAB1_9PAST